MVHAATDDEDVKTGRRIGSSSAAISRLAMTAPSG